MDNLDPDLRYALRRLGVDTGTHAWVARYGDRSSAAVFGTEIEALRYAVDRHMEVVHVPYGEDIFTYQPDSP